MLGLPDGIAVCLFDLDGVLTRTAQVHAAAWKQMFDDYLRERARERGEPFVPFDAVDDYDEYVDGRPRYEGVRSFLASRGIELPHGTPDDPPEAETIDGLDIYDLIEQIVDGAVADRQHLKGKPASDTYLAGVRALGVHRRRRPCSRTRWPASKRGGPAPSASSWTVDRVAQAEALRAHGTDVVVGDLTELLDVP